MVAEIEQQEIDLKYVRFFVDFFRRRGIGSFAAFLEGRVYGFSLKILESVFSNDPRVKITERGRGQVYLQMRDFRGGEVYRAYEESKRQSNLLGVL